MVHRGEFANNASSLVAAGYGRFLQPLDTGDAERNAQIRNAAIEYIKKDPRWKLSLQTHKMLNIR